MKSAISSYLCSWCRCSKQKLDKSTKCLSDSDILLRPDIEDLSQNNIETQWQNPKTFNLFSIKSDITELHRGLLLVPPPLHIKLGLINKIVDSLPLIVKHFADKHSIDEDENNAFNNHLAFSLSKVGARRENYYSGKLSGVPCSNLMLNMVDFCVLFSEQALLVILL